MNTAICRVPALSLAVAILFTIAYPLSAQQPGTNPQPPPDVPPTPGIDIQARGPIHEAFAQPTDATPQLGPTIPRQPPDPIPEVPPDEKPAAAGVEWIPGYWAWDDERQDFLWVSGCWRVPPPDRRWVPGYWNQVEGGWQWVSGFWAPLDQQELPYLPEAPPPSLDSGPSVPAPDDNSIYVPGSWIYRETRYLWRPGFWIGAQPGYVWTPASYCATPSGYLFVDGYWDRCLEDRGLLFAPVCFTQPLWQNPGWAYQPNYCIGTDGLLASLFVRPRWGHYYFGDYYGNAYLGAGYRPWFGSTARYHDGLFNYYRWAHRGNPGWDRGLGETYRGRLAGTLPRPARTFVAQQTLIRNLSARQQTVGINSLHTVRPLGEFRNQTNLRLTRINQTQIMESRRIAQLHHAAGQARAGFEATRGHQAGRPTALPLARVSAVRAPAGPRTIAAPAQPRVAQAPRTALSRPQAGARPLTASRSVPRVSSRPGAVASRPIAPTPGARSPATVAQPRVTPRTTPAVPRVAPGRATPATRPSPAPRAAAPSRPAVRPAPTTPQAPRSVARPAPAASRPAVTAPRQIAPAA